MSFLKAYDESEAATLTEVLAAAYPVIRRLVDPRFFAYAADRFIAAHPPVSPCLSQYGDAFAEFLGCFEPCRAHPYLPDVARLEWAMHRAQDAADAAILDPRLIADVLPDDLERLTFRFHPSVTLLHSPWPVDRIWRAVRPAFMNTLATATRNSSGWSEWGKRPRTATASTKR
jgi:hypothetical protein